MAAPEQALTDMADAEVAQELTKVLISLSDVKLANMLKEMRQKSELAVHQMQQESLSQNVMFQSQVDQCMHSFNALRRENLLLRKQFEATMDSMWKLNGYMPPWVPNPQVPMQWPCAAAKSPLVSPLPSPSPAPSPQKKRHQDEGKDSDGHVHEAPEHPATPPLAARTQRSDETSPFGSRAGPCPAAASSEYAKTSVETPATSSSHAEAPQTPPELRRLAPVTPARPDRNAPEQTPSPLPQLSASYLPVMPLSLSGSPVLPPKSQEQRVLEVKIREREAQIQMLLPQAIATRTFVLTLMRLENMPLGLEVVPDGISGDGPNAKQGMEWLVVKGVLAEGVVGAWNRQCDDDTRLIMPGDLIVSVNGANGANAMREECARSRLLKLTVLRGASDKKMQADVPTKPPGLHSGRPEVAAGDTIPAGPRVSCVSRQGCGSSS